MDDNHLKKSFYWLAWVIAILFLLSFIGKFSLGRFKFKRVNVLTDIQKDTLQPVAKKDSVKQKSNKPAAKKTPCPPGITCVEDYSDNKNALGKFFRGLKESRRRPVRAAFFGDSFIEGDILCASFRDTLQQLFGGQGVGYVPITSEVTQFRTTIRHSFSGWKTYWAVGEKSPIAPLGLSGYCFIPQQENVVEYKPGKKGSGMFHKARLFYTSPLPVQLYYALDDSLSYDQSLEPSRMLQQTVLLCEGAQAIKLHFEPYDSLKLYGISFESKTGMYVDNFAMRGNSGMGLLQTSIKEMKEFNRFQNYKLILLQYGLNVVGESDTIGYDWYTDRMVRVINRLKENFPESSIVLLGISDRSYNQNGKFVTMPNIKLMRRAQRELARKSKIAFWDVFAAMGGENSMVKFVAANPPMAAKDYTHLTYWGGKKLAKKLAEALYMNARNMVQRQKRLLSLLALFFSCITLLAQDTLSAGETIKFDFLDKEENRIHNTVSLSDFYEKLYRLREGDPLQVRIIHIGDSHIQADYLSSVIRQNFHRDFGNAGRGLIFPDRVARTNEPSNFFTSSNSVWEVKRIIFPEQPLPIGIGGITLRTVQPNATLAIKVLDAPALDYSFNKVTLFFKKDISSFNVVIKDSLNEDVAFIGPYTFEPFPNTSTVLLPFRTHYLTFQMLSSTVAQNQATIFGINLENGRPGLVYHAIGVNGAKFKHYLLAELFVDQTAALVPDLVILSLGTNEALDYPYFDPQFVNQMDSLIQRLMAKNPSSRILLTTPPDSFRRKTRRNPGVEIIRNKISSYADLHNLACWDLYQVGGGNHSADFWKRNRLMQHDGIHFTVAGYTLQADLLYDALMKGYDEYVQYRHP